MDSFTHIAIGASIGELVLGRRVGLKAPIWGAAVASIPDLDGIVGLMVHPTREIFIHRGFSHSFLFVALMAPLLGWIISRVHRSCAVGWIRWALLVLLAMASHVLLDLFNTYGTGILYPFTSHRFAFDSMAIFDLFLFLPLLAATLILFIKRLSDKLRRWVSIGAILFTACYVAWSATNKLAIERKVAVQLQEQSIQYSRIRTAPLPLSNLLWLVLAEDSTGYHVGYRGLFDQGEIVFRYLSRNEGVLDTLVNNHYVKELVRFSEGYYTVTLDTDTSFWLHDLRYGSLAFHEWEQWYVFSFYITHSNHELLKVGRAHPDRRISCRNARKYFRRIIRME